MSYHRIFFTNVLYMASLRGMSHQDLAEKANLSASLMSGITRGQGNPTLETMVAIASALGAPLSYLLEHHDLDADSFALFEDDCNNIDTDSLPSGYEKITVILSNRRAFLVKQWNAETLKALAKK